MPWRWPFFREKRESGGDFADAVVQLIEAQAAGTGTAADASSTAAVEAASGALSRAFASAVSKYVKSHLIRKLKSPLNPSTEVACMFSLRTGGHPCSSEETI